MTSTEFASYIRFLTRTDSTTLTDADILLIANVKRIEIAKRIEAIDEDYFGAILTTDLVASATSREYTFPDVLMDRFKKVAAKLDGVNWVTLTEFDMSKFKDEDGNYNIPMTEAEMLVHPMIGNEQGRAFYDIFRSSLFLYTGSIAGEAVVEGNAGFKMWGYFYPAKLTALNGSTDLSVPSSNTTTAIPTLFHDLWAEQVSITWKQSQDAKVILTEREKAWEYNMRLALDSFANVNRDREIIREVPVDPIIGNGDNL